MIASRSNRPLFIRLITAHRIACHRSDWLICLLTYSLAICAVIRYTFECVESKYNCWSSSTSLFVPQPSIDLPWSYYPRSRSDPGQVTRPLARRHGAPQFYVAVPAADTSPTRHHLYLHINISLAAAAAAAAVAYIYIYIYIYWKLSDAFNAPSASSSSPPARSSSSNSRSRNVGTSATADVGAGAFRWSSAATSQDAVTGRRTDLHGSPAGTRQRRHPPRS